MHGCDKVHTASGASDVALLHKLRPTPLPLPSPPSNCSDALHKQKGPSTSSTHSVAGKGIKGFVAKPGQQARSVSPTKRKQKAVVKVIVGNKKMMAQEGISISQTVDDYMREMEVAALYTSDMLS